jgi:methylated-DNA-[protein]-cysteine S-methyltransferase
MVYFTYCESPIQPLLLLSDGRSLTGLYTVSETHILTLQADWLEDDTALPFTDATRQLKAYFDGQLTEFTVPLAMQGTTFQRRVWNELQEIPYGKTLSYGELANRIGQPQASRAVGLANGRNPISILVPCHRVIGANGKLTGYGGGLERKQWLLEHESKLISPQQFNLFPAQTGGLAM